jgi:hypothetical protein
MIPLPQMNTLLQAVARAVGHVRAGEIAAGYDLLLAGLWQAEKEQHAGAPWGAELVQRYRHALDTYALRYGVKISVGDDN